MSIIFSTTDKIKYANTKAACGIHKFDEFDIAKLCYDDKLNEFQVLHKVEYRENRKLYAGFAIHHLSKDCLLFYGTFGDYFIQFKDGLAAIVTADDFKEMNKNDFIELHNKIKERLHE